MIDAAVGWVSRRAIVYLLLVAALVVGPALVPRLRAGWATPEVTRTRVVELTALAAGLEREKAEAAGRYKEAVGKTRQSSVAELERRIRLAQQQRLKLIGERPRSTNLVVRLAQVGQKGVLDDHKREFYIVALTREIETLEAARNLAVAGSRSRILGTRALSLNQALRTATFRCQEATNRLSEFELKWRIEQFWKRKSHRALKDQKAGECHRKEELGRAVRGLTATLDAARAAESRARMAVTRATSGLEGALNGVTAGLEKQIRDDQASLSGSLRERARVYAERIDLKRKLKAAGWLLLGIIATPYLIRITFYHGLAPLAERRRMIRLDDTGSSRRPIVPLSPRSETSVGLRLRRDEELLVRQNYLQSTSQDSSKRTRWLLDYRHPFSSIAAGLTFLTRIRGEAHLTTVSAVQDGCYSELLRHLI